MNDSESPTAPLLRKLYDNCLQAEVDYRIASGVAEDDDLQYLFASYALQRGRLARELNAALTATGAAREQVENVEDREKETHETGFPTSGDLLARCAGREEIATELYKDLLRCNDLGESLRLVLLRQLEEVSVILERLRQLHGLAYPT